MPNSTFTLDILTPEKQFFSGAVGSLRLSGLMGEFVVMKGHAPMIAAIPIGELSFTIEDELKTAVHAEGFLEIYQEHAVLLVQSCEWPEDIDLIRAQASLDKANERLRQKQSIVEQKHVETSIARAMVRLRIKRGR